MSALAQALTKALENSVVNTVADPVVNPVVSIVDGLDKLADEHNVSVTAVSVVNALNRRHISAGMVQDGLVAIVERLSKAEKVAEIRHDRDLPYIFATQIKGDDLSRLAQWLGGHTPIRVRFDKDTGRYKDVDISPTWVPARKKAGLPIWDLAGLRLEDWRLYKPENRRAPADPALTRGMMSLAREAARMLDTNPSCSYTKVKDDITKLFEEQFLSMIMEVQRSDKHKEYVKAWQDCKAEKVREAK